MWAYVAIVANGVAGLVALVAFRVLRLRGRVVWSITIAAEIAMLVQVFGGVVLVANDQYTVARFHIFYGIVAFLTIAMAYAYHRSMRGRVELYYGLIGLFVMGLGIRAVFELGT